MTWMRAAERLRARLARSARARSGSDAGESLIELIIAVTIMSVAVVTIVGAIATSIMMSDIHRKQTTASSYVRSYAEAILAAAQTGYPKYDPGEPGMNGCGLPSTIAFEIPAPDTHKYTYSAKVTSCISRNLESVTVTVGSTDGRDTETLDVTIRRPCVAPTKADANLDPGCQS